MGVIRGGLLSIVVVLLFLSLLAGGFLLTLSISLSYENVKPELSSTIKGLIEEQVGDQEDRYEYFNSMQIYCENNSEISLAQEGFSLDIPCDVVAQGLDSVITYASEALIDDIYYAEYECGFWNCLVETEQPFFLISQKAQDYWLSRFYIALIAVGILAILAFLLVERKTSFPILLGILILIAGLPLLKTDLLTSLFGDAFYSVFSIFFSQATSIAWIMIIAGAILIVLGIILKIGFRDWVKKKFSRQEVKEIVKKEVAKSKQEVKKPAMKPVKKPAIPTKPKQPQKPIKKKSK